MAVAGEQPGASWAAVAVSEQPAKGAAAPTAEAASTMSTAVIDANAIMGGFPLDRLAERLVTIPEVLEEVRDAKSRERLAALHVVLETLEPTAEAVAAVTRFARATGDLHSLSAVDIKLVALAYTLEAATYGTSHLRDLPAPPRAKPRKRGPDARRLPGWGQAGGIWTELDKLDEEAEAAAAAASSMGGSAVQAAQPAISEAAAPSADADGEGVSRIAAGVQAIDLSQEHGLDASFGSEAGDASVDGRGGDSEGGSAAAMDTPGQEHPRKQQLQQQDQEQQGAEGDDGDWEVAAGSRAAARRKQRKDRRFQQRQTWRAEAAAAQAAEEQAAASDSDEWMSDDGSEAGTDAGTAAAPSDAGTASTAQPRESDSSIVSVTADFSMQNVLLQMGLRLGTPDGRCISHVSRWVLRCSACFFVTKEAGRLFCPQCGNATMEKVEVTTGPDGAEQYGIRRKHNLRGTRFSLPKPKGGRQDGVPVLREDVMLQRMPHMRAQVAKAGVEVDPFAPEHGRDYWFAQDGGDGRKGSAAARHAKGAAALLAGWKHNPNERKHVRTNRRRK